MVAVAVVVGAAAILALLPAGRREPIAAPRPAAGAAVVDPSSVRTNALIGEAGVIPYASALADVRAEARRALRESPRPGPLPAFADVLRDDAFGAYALAIAAAAGGGTRFRGQAARIVEAWTESSAAEASCDATAGCPLLGAVPGTTLLVVAADVLRRIGALDSATFQATLEWARSLVPDGELPDDESGDEVLLARIVVAQVGRDDAALDAAVIAWRERLDLIGPDGRLRTAAARGRLGMARTQAALGPALLAGVLAGGGGSEIVTAHNSSRVGLKDAIDHLARHWSMPDSWPGGPSRPASPSGLWELAGQVWSDQAYRPILEDLRSRGSDERSLLAWTVITQRLPPLTAVGDPTPSSSGPATSPGAGASIVVSPAPSPTVVAPSVVPGLLPSPSPDPQPATLQVAPPSVSFTTGDIGRGGGIPVLVRWAPAIADGVEAADLRYRLELKQGSGDFVRVGIPARSTRATLFLAAGPSYRLRLRARAGQEVSPWATSPFRLRRDEPTAARMSTGWSIARSSDYTAGVALSATRAGAQLTYRFRGRSFAIQGPVGPTRGAVEIKIDGRAVVVDLHRPDFDPTRVLFATSWREAGTHTARVRVLGTAGHPTVAVDAFLVVP